MYIIEAESLSRRYSDRVAVDCLDLRVTSGCIFGLIGSNGAGKTTTVRMLATLLKPSSGTARIDGFDIRQKGRQIRRIIGYVPQEAQADEALTGREHLILQGRLYDMAPSLMNNRIHEVLELVGLSSEADRRALHYSGGMRKLLDIATGLLHMPKLLFLDEPTAGIDVAHRTRILDYIRHLPTVGTTVFLTSHFLEEIDQLADQIALLDKGKVIVQGIPAELKASLGSSVVEIALDGGERLQEIALELNTLDYVTRTIAHGNVLKVFGTRNDELLDKVRGHMAHLGIRVRTLRVAQLTLDDVFFYHVRQQVN